MAGKVTMTLAETVMVPLHRVCCKQHFTFLRESSHKVYREALSLICVTAREHNLFLTPQ